MFTKRKNTAPQRLDIPALEADPNQGLTPEQVQQRQDGGWANGLPASVNETEGEIILRNTVTFFNLIFVVLAVILALSGSSIKNMAFLIAAACNTVIGCFQEIRAKRAVDKLTLMAAAMVKTIRGGEETEVRSDLLVRDDIVEFGPGDQICADGILRCGQLSVNESLITGEADAILKKSGDQLRSGSFVISGTGRVQLTQVGGDSFVAKLSAEAKANPRAAKSEMMRSLDRLIKVMGIALIPIGCLLFYQEFQVLNRGMTTSAESTVAALVGMIPEGLYLLTSVAMAVSALKLTKQRVLVQDMNCIETLARVDVLCVDKTGTITEPGMEVEQVIPLSKLPPERLEQILGAFYYGQKPENATGKAMAELFAKKTGWECIHRVPFSSETKWSAAAFRDQGVYLIGAPEFIMGSRYPELADTVEEWAKKGYRVLLAAAYEGDPQPGQLVLERLTPLALTVLTNRLRPTARDTFTYFAKQGVSIRVISGDNPATVSEVARRAGIAGAERYVDAESLLTDRDIQKAAESCVVFGRVTPEQKKKLIRALRKQGHTVAMTGDGVNDVLAMREADCGIAMASGAQAASQVAQLVLLDSDFAAMPSIVGEGRRVINNIQRAAALFLVKNIFSLGLALISLLTQFPYPLIPLHMSMISTLTIGVPSFFLAMEPNYDRVYGSFLRGVLRRAFPGGLTNIVLVLAAQVYMSVFGLPGEQISTVCAAMLSIVGLLVLYQVCKPFDKFRRLIWAMMALALVGCFTLIKGFLELYIQDTAVIVVLVTLLIMAPFAFFGIQRVFDWGDKAVLKLRKKK